MAVRPCNAQLVREAGALTADHSVVTSGLQFEAAIVALAPLHPVWMREIDAEQIHGTRRYTNTHTYGQEGHNEHVMGASLIISFFLELK